MEHGGVFQLQVYGKIKKSKICYWYTTFYTSKSNSICTKVARVKVGDTFWNITAHWACDTVWFLDQSTPAFIPPDLWPPNSIDLNPVDYKQFIRYGVTSSSKCISHSWRAFTNWRTVCWTFGMAWTTASLTTQLTGGVSILERIYR